MTTKNNMNDLDKRVIGSLKPGKDNVINSYELASRYGINQKSIGFCVGRARKAGIPVGSIHGEGYYLISNDAELEETIEHIEKRKRGIDLTITALRDGYASA